MSHALTLPQAIQMALQHHQAGRLGEAENLYRLVLQADPNHLDALHLLGLLAHQTGNNGLAVELIGKAIDLNPEIPAFHGNIGLAHQALGNLDAAIAHFRKAIALKPDHAGAYNNLGNALKSRGALNDAIACYRQALAFNPEYAEAHNNLGVALQEQGKPDDAGACFQKALALKPDYAEAHNNLGIAYKNQGKPGVAIECYRKALACKPGYGEALNNQGVALQSLGRVDEAIACFRAALALKPDFASARYNLALCCLLLGDYAAGLEYYEVRFQGGKPDDSARAMLAKLAATPRWENQDLRGKTLLVWAEQGQGDTIMMLRYLPLLAGKNPGKIVVACESALANLVKMLPGIAEVILPGDNPVACDYHCPMMSLPQRFATRLDTIPDTIPYLSVPAAMRAEWRARLTGLAGIKVGLVWAGNPAFARDAARSLPLQEFSPLLGVPGISFISLQKGEPAAQLDKSAWPIHDWMEECRDFLDTAALLENLDLVIGVDTAVAHLAGALGKPVWLLNRFESEWRWMLEREDSPWYPTLRIFRQAAPGDWDSVLARLAEELTKLCRLG